MTRIVAGSAGGRRLKVPPRGTRPTSEKVREALFSSLEHHAGLAGARVLDLYAGSGALALEAASRGARAVAVESDAAACRIIEANARALGLDVSVRRARVERFLASGPGAGGEPFAIVLADPPYALESAALSAVLEQLEQGGWLQRGAEIVIERDRRSAPVIAPACWTGRGRRDYGETSLTTWTRS